MQPKFLLAVGFFFSLSTLSQTKTYWDPESCLRMKNISAVRPSPDGKKVLYTVRQAVMTDDRSEYVNQVFVCNGDGSNTVQLTRGDKNSFNPKWRPDGKWVAFTAGRDGKNNIYLLPLDGGESEMITDAKNGVNNFEWSRDGSMIAYTMTDAASDTEEKNKKAKNDWYFYDEEFKQNRLYVLWLNEKDSAGKRKTKLITKDNRNVISFNWSPDGKWLVYDHGRSSMVNDNVYSDIAMVNIETGEAKNVANTEAGESDPQFSRDGKWIAYVLSEEPVVWGGKNWISIVSISGGPPRKLASTPNDLPGIIGWSQDGNHIFVGENNRTLFSIYSLATDGKAIEEWNKSSQRNVPVYIILSIFCG